MTEVSLCRPAGRCDPPTRPCVTVARSAGGWTGTDVPVHGTVELADVDAGRRNVAGCCSDQLLSAGVTAAQLGTRVDADAGLAVTSTGRCYDLLVADRPARADGVPLRSAPHAEVCLGRCKPDTPGVLQPCTARCPNPTVSEPANCRASADHQA